MMKASSSVAICVLHVSCALAGCGKASPPGHEPSAPEASARPASAPAVAATGGEAADAVIGFHGFGPARFGANEEAVRMSWGRPLEISGTATDSCRQLFMDPRPATGYGISFMLIDGVFARYDVDDPRHLAPGGEKVGDDADAVTQRHAGRVEAMPHKYEPGARYLIVTPADGGAARLVFEVGPDQRITRWRIGMPPAVFQVEGCS